MSIVNLGLQSIGLARQEMSEEMEAEFKKCKSFADLRRIAERKPEIVPATADSLSPVKILLTRILQRLQLKGTNFKTFVAATQEEINDCGETSLVDTSITPDDTTKAKMRGKDDFNP